MMRRTPASRAARPNSRAASRSSAAKSLVAPWSGQGNSRVDPGQGGTEAGRIQAVALHNLCARPDAPVEGLGPTRQTSNAMPRVFQGRHQATSDVSGCSRHQNQSLISVLITKRSIAAGRLSVKYFYMF